MLQTKLVDSALKAWTIEQRRHFHMHPELSGQEFETAAYVKEKLAEFGIPVDSRFSEPNVIAYFKGTEGKRRLHLEPIWMLFLFTKRVTSHTYQPFPVLCMVADTMAIQRYYSPLRNG